MSYTNKGPGDIAPASPWENEPSAEQEEREAIEWFERVYESLRFNTPEQEMVNPSEVDEEFTSALAHAGYGMANLIDTLRDSDNEIHKKAVECYDGAVYTITEQEYLT